MILLDDGRPVAQGTPDRVFASEPLSRAFHAPVLVDRNPSSDRSRVTWVGTRDAAGL